MEMEKVFGSRKKVGSYLKINYESQMVFLDAFKKVNIYQFKKKKKNIIIVKKYYIFN